VLLGAVRVLRHIHSDCSVGRSVSTRPFEYEIGVDDRPEEHVAADTTAARRTSRAQRGAVEPAVDAHLESGVDRVARLDRPGAGAPVDGTFPRLAQLDAVLRVSNDRVTDPLARCHLDVVALEGLHLRRYEVLIGLTDSAPGQAGSQRKDADDRPCRLPAPPRTHGVSLRRAVERQCGPGLEHPARVIWLVSSRTCPAGASTRGADHPGRARP